MGELEMGARWGERKENKVPVLFLTFLIGSQKEMSKTEKSRHINTCL